ncbi:MAG TPA: LamG-like jellyroll fold domain-containing protein [Verrucomicrobiae bacterium]|nr:LamG-like jellyroll fold domain-containing protein [Verrucomicrobiae bacterium]
MKTHHASNQNGALLAVPNRLQTLLAVMLLSSGLQAATPIVDLPFNEGEGTVTVNDGTYGGSATFATVTTNTLPYFTNNVPTGPYAPAGNTFAVALEEIGGNTGGRAVDLVTTIGTGNLGTEFPGLTICGWLNARTLQVGAGGNRIAECFETGSGQNGFDLVHNAEGKLTLSINQFPDNLPTSSGSITANPNLANDNWVFFAVTWDLTLSANQVKYYFGSAAQLAYFDSSQTYTLPVALPVFDYAGPLTVGNFVSAVAARNAIGGNSRQFRGLLDEIRVYTNALTIEEIQQAQLDNPVVPPVAVSFLSQPQTSVLLHEGQSPVFNVLAAGSGELTYQWQTNNVDVPGATNRSFTFASVTTADSGTVVRVLVDNAATADPGLASDGTTLTVVPEDSHKISVSFSEGAGTTTANFGNLAGYGTIQVNNGYPKFSSNVPNGPFAPSASHNRASLDMGLIYAGQGNRAVDFTNSFNLLPGTLGGFTSMTICGWLNSGHTNIGSGGNRIVSALLTPGGAGFDLVHLNDGSLQLGVNQYPNGTPTSAPGMITSDESGSNENWVFFAVTYDSALEIEPVKFYFGKPDQKVAFSSAITYSTNRGVIDPSGVMTIGNFGSVVAARTATGTGNNGSRNFRGLMDEIQIFNRVLTLEEIEAVQTAPALPPSLQITPQGTQVSLSWAATTPLQLQSRTNLSSGTWNNVTVAPEVSGNVRTVTLPATQETEFFRLSQ